MHDPEEFWKSTGQNGNLVRSRNGDNSIVRETKYPSNCHPGSSPKGGKSYTVSAWILPIKAMQKFCSSSSLTVYYIRNLKSAQILVFEREFTTISSHHPWCCRQETSWVKHQLTIWIWTLGLRAPYIVPSLGASYYIPAHQISSWISEEPDAAGYSDSDANWLRIHINLC